MIAAVCNASNPPIYNSVEAIAARTIPQIILIRFGGFKLPCVVNIPKTNVAESADVIKNVAISKIPKTDKAIQSCPSDRT